MDLTWQHLQSGGRAHCKYNNVTATENQLGNLMFLLCSPKVFGRYWSYGNFKKNLALIVGGDSILNIFMDLSQDYLDMCILSVTVTNVLHISMWKEIFICFNLSQLTSKPTFTFSAGKMLFLCCGELFLVCSISIIFRVTVILEKMCSFLITS